MRRFFCIMLLFGCGVELQAAHRSIAETVQLSIQHHPDIQAQRGEVAKSDAALDITTSGYLPVVTLNAGIGREDSNNSATRAANAGGSEELERRESGITLRQMLFDGFETHWQHQRRKDLQQSARLDLEERINDIALRAVDQHLSVAAHARILALHVENLGRHEKIARDIATRVRSGKDDRAKVSQISARVALAQANLEVAREQLNHATAAYIEVAGVAPSHTLLWQEGLVKLPDSLEALRAAIRAAHPSLLAEQAREQAAEDAWRATKHHRYPKLFFESGANWQDNIDGIKGLNRDAYALFRVEYELYQGGGDRARQREARVAQWQQDQRGEQLLRELNMQADQAWYSYQSQGRRLGHLQDYVEAAEQTRTAYEKQFNIGPRSLIDLLDAENEVLRARSEWVQATRALYLVKYQMLALQNRLLDSLQVTHAHAKTILAEQ